MNAFTNMANTLFNNNELAVDATYKANGTGAQTPVRVVLTHGVDLSGLGQSSVAELTTVIDVRKSEVGTIKIGDTYTVGNALYTMAALIEDDGLVAKIAVRIGSAIIIGLLFNYIENSMYLGLGLV